MDWVKKHWWIVPAVFFVGAVLIRSALWVTASDSGHRTRDEILDTLTTIVEEQEEEEEARESKKEYTRQLCEEGELKPESEACQWARQPD